MINNDGVIDQSDVRLMVSGTGISNVLYDGIVRAVYGTQGSTNSTFTSTNWTTSYTKTGGTTTVYDNDLGNQSQNWVQATSGSFFPTNTAILTYSTLLPAITGYVYGISANDIAGSSTNPADDYKASFKLYACDSGGNGEVELEDYTDPWGAYYQKAKMPSGKTHIKVKAGLYPSGSGAGGNSQNTWLKIVGPLKLNYFDPSSRDTDVDVTGTPGYFTGYRAPTVLNYDSIQYGQGFTGARYRASKYLLSPPGTTTNYYVYYNDPDVYIPAGVQVHGVAKVTVYSPTTGAGTALSRVRIGVIPYYVTTESSVNSTPSTHVIWSSWVTPTSGTSTIVAQLDHTAGKNTQWNRKIIVQIERVPSRANPIYFDQIAWYPAATTSMDTSEYHVVYGQNNILAGTYSIDMKREELELGILTAGIKDASLDPAVESGLKQGGQVSLQLNDKLLDGDTDNWVEVFTGRINRIKSSWNEQRKIDIQLSAVDSYAKLGTFPFQWAFATVADLGAPLAWIGIYVNADGSLHGSGQVQSAGVSIPNLAAVDTSMKAVDSVIITRNTVQGEAYVDKEDVLQIKSDSDYSPLKANAVIEFSDVSDTSNTKWIPYSINGIDVGFDTTRVINQVEINQALGSENAKYTFTNKESYDLRGPAKIELETIGLDETAATSLATAILDKYEVPTITATYVRYPVKRRRDLKLTAQVEITDPIHVFYTDKVDANFRVNRIHMNIKPGRMIVELGFDINKDGVFW